MEVNNMEEKDVILTQEGYDNLDKELNYLKTEKRAEIADRIKVALGFGDLFCRDWNWKQKNRKVS